MTEQQRFGSISRESSTSSVRINSTDLRRYDEEQKNIENEITVNERLNKKPSQTYKSENIIHYSWAVSFILCAINAKISTAIGPSFENKKITNCQEDSNKPSNSSL